MIEFTNTDVKYCNECKGTYKIRLLKIGTNDVALCMNCRDKLYEVIDSEDTLIVYEK